MDIKIFQIGFNRCGTTSIYKFFKENCQNNLKCCHFEKGKLALDIYNNFKSNKKLLQGSIYENYNVYTDMEFCSKNFIFQAGLYFEYLDKQYPNSKFILNTRNLENWIRSRLNHYSRFLSRKLLENLFGKNVEDFWKKQWINHHDKVSNYFANRPEDLLIFNIETKDASNIIEFFPYLKFKTNKFEKNDYILNKIFF